MSAEATPLSDAAKLRTLATWFDNFDDWREATKRIAPGISEYREVQIDLRRIADALDAERAAHPEPPTVEVPGADGVVHTVWDLAAHPVPEGLREARDELAGLSLPLGSTREAAKHERDTALAIIDRVLAATPAPLPDAEPWLGPEYAAALDEHLGAAPLPDAEGLDVERLAEALHMVENHIFDDSVALHREGQSHPLGAHQLTKAADIAREYAALQSDPK